jgi:hypothetical protein
MAVSCEALGHELVYIGRTGRRGFSSMTTGCNGGDRFDLTHDSSPPRMVVRGRWKAPPVE